MASIKISGYTFSTTSVPTTPALRVESGTGTYYVNLTTSQRPEALSDQKVFTVSTTDYSFLRPFVTSNSLMGYSGVSNNSTLTTGYSGVSNNSTITTGYAGVSNNSTVTTGYSGVSSRSSTYGYSGYSSFASSITTTASVTATTLSVSQYTLSGFHPSYIFLFSYRATFSPLAPYEVNYQYNPPAKVVTYSTHKGIVEVIGYGDVVDMLHVLFTYNNETYTYGLDKNFTGVIAFTKTDVVWTHKNTTVSKTTDKSGVLLSQVALTRSSAYNSSSAAVGNLSNTTAITETATRYSSSTAVGNLSNTTALTNTATRYSSSTEKAYLSSVTDLTNTATRYSSSVAVGNLSSTTELRTITRL